MGDAGLLRFLELVKRELQAEDARLEIGGAPPSDPLAVWTPAGPSRRLVACFATAPSDPEDQRARLEALVEAFRGVATEQAAGVEVAAATLAPAGLDGEVAVLAERAGAAAALVVDASSPRVWGCSRPELRYDVDLLMELANAAQRVAGGEPDQGALLDRLRQLTGPVDARLMVLLSNVEDDGLLGELLLCGRAIRAARTQLRKAPTSLGSLRQLERFAHGEAFVRSIGGIYLLVLVFDDAFSELRVEGVVKRARGHLEDLLAALPPDEPPPKGGRLLPLREP